MAEIIIHTNERGLLFIEGNYSNVLKSGKYNYSKSKREIVVMDLNAEFKAQNYPLNILLKMKN